MKTKDITELTAVYGQQQRYGKPRKIVVLSTGIWTMDGFAARHGRGAFERHQKRPVASYSRTLGVLVLSAPVETGDAELLAAATAVDVAAIQATGAAPELPSEDMIVEVIYTKDVIALATVLDEVREVAERKAASLAERDARQVSVRKLTDLSGRLGIELPDLDIRGGVRLPHADMVALLERLALAEGK